MGRAFDDISRQWGEWWQGRRQRMAQAVWHWLWLLAMTTVIAILYGFSSVGRLLVRHWVLGGLGAATLVVLALVTHGPSAPEPAAVASAVVPAHSVPAKAVAPAPVVAAHHESAHAGGQEGHGEAHHAEEAGGEGEEAAASAAQGFSVFATIGEAVLNGIGESLGFFEIGEKINGVFIPLKNGDTDTAVSKGAGAATEYSMAVYLVDAFEIMGLIASGMIFETVAGIAGSVAIVRSSAAAGDKVEETTHRKLTDTP